jgi:hypothetical protein
MAQNRFSVPKHKRMSSLPNITKTTTYNVYDVLYVKSIGPEKVYR